MIPRRPGPLPGVARRQYTLLIDEELGDWGKAKPGGLSGLVRRLLQEEKSKEERIIATQKQR